MVWPSLHDGQKTWWSPKSYTQWHGQKSNLVWPDKKEYGRKSFLLLLCLSDFKGWWIALDSKITKSSTSRGFYDSWVVILDIIKQLTYVQLCDTVRPWDARFLGNEKNSCSSNSCNLSCLIGLGQDHQKNMQLKVLAT